MRSQREGATANRPRSLHPDRETITSRFRFIPEQPNVHPLVVDHIVGKSVRQVEGGWTWKFDPSVYDHLSMGADQSAKFQALPCRSAVVLGENSTSEGVQHGAYMAGLKGGALPIFSIPGAYHHLMLDDPLAVVAAVKATLLNWLREDQDRIRH